MTVKDLKKVTFDNVCLYKQVSDEEFEDLYKGKIEDVPVGFLDCEIVCFGAKRKDLLDIHIKYV